jgi:hypothetical protein
MKHPQFKDSPCLYKNADRIKFYEVSEEELLDIYAHVHDKTDYKYDVSEGEIIVKDYIDWLNTDEIKKGTEEFKEKQAKGLASAPTL